METVVHGGWASRRKVLAGSLGLAAAGLAVTRPAFRAFAEARSLAVATRAGEAFQTPVALTIAGPRSVDLDAGLEAAFTAIRNVEVASSVYRVDGELTRLNREGALRAPSRHLLTLLRYTLSLSQRTDGRYDPTVQPLWDLWAACHARGSRPCDQELAPVLARVDWRGVHVEDALVRFDRPGLAVTLNSINQGYAADVVMDLLRDRGIEHAFIDTGEFGASGHHPDGRAWRLGVVAPRDPKTLAFTVDPFRRFSATSGDYETFFSPDFRDHHIFDPRTGRSPPDWSSITVFAPSGLIADGLSTALFTLDAQGAAALLSSEPDCSARFFGKDGTEIYDLA